MIAHTEFERRWSDAQAAAKERGFEALVVWSRGGGTVDSFADVMYLANHYSPFPAIADIPGNWVGRSHSAVVLPLDGAPTLIVDQVDWRRDLVAVEDVRFSIDLPREVARVLTERGLDTVRVGLVGGNAMLASPYRHLLDQAAGVDFVPADDLLEAIRLHKSPAEQDLLRAAGAAGDRMVDAVMKAAMRPGTTEAEAVAAGYAVAVAECVAPYDAAIASGPHSDYYAYGRLPSWTNRPLEEGDFFHIDTYGALDGYLYDLARCCVVGGRPSGPQIEVMEAVIDAVHAGVDCARPGASMGELYTAVRSVLAEREMLPPDDGPMVSALTTSFPAHGHSYGMGWERPWIVEDGPETLAAGMVFGIEAMAGRAGVGSAKFEQDILITETGAELLTKLETRYW